MLDGRDIHLSAMVPSVHVQESLCYMVGFIAYLVEGGLYGEVTLIL